MSFIQRSQYKASRKWMKSKILKSLALVHKKACVLFPGGVKVKGKNRGVRF